MRPEAVEPRPSPGSGNPFLRPAVKALLAAICFLALVGLGVLARTALVTRHDLHVDVKAEAFRFPLATSLSLAATAAASEAVGIGVLLIAVAALVVRGRRWDAARLFATVGASWVLGIAVKLLIDRTRPPASLWLLKPDSVDSFPSGHDTTACVMIVIALVVFRGLPRLRLVATALATAFAVAVGASRIYLGDHYPTDVLGSWLTVAAAALLVWAVTDLRPLRRLGTRVLKDPRPAPRLV
ncbi:MAG: phosphatase PAP2 family protein [Amnibacterium sp.]